MSDSSVPLTPRNLFIVIALVLFVIAAIVGFGWWDDPADEIHGIIASGFASFMVAHLV